MYAHIKARAIFIQNAYARYRHNIMESWHARAFARNFSTHRICTSFSTDPGRALPHLLMPSLYSSYNDYISNYNNYNNNYN